MTNFGIFRKYARGSSEETVEFLEGFVGTLGNGRSLLLGQRKMASGENCAIAL